MRVKGAPPLRISPDRGYADSVRPVSDVPRYRCSACGNLTRFDVTTTTRVRSFHHYTVGGALAVEDAEVLEERVDEVLCRWCGTGTAVEVAS